MNWFALDVTLDRRAREAVEYALMEAGALGTESYAAPGDAEPDNDAGEDSRERVTAYFDSPPSVERVRAALAEALRVYGLASSDVREMSVREVEERDWLAEWKKNWRAVEVGRFVVAPPWSEVSDEEDRIVIRVEPGMAFGTGTHETTRLCLAAIEKYFRGGILLHAGPGPGILAHAPAALPPPARRPVGGPG